MRQTQARFGMRRLSAEAKSKRDVCHLLAFVALALAVGWLAWRTGHAPPWGVVVAWLLPAIVVLPPLIRRILAANVVDEAWVDDGDLLLKRGSESARMPLDNIATVATERQSNLVTLDLRLPCAFGNQVRFITRRWSARDIGVELRQRMAEARRHA